MSILLRRHATRTAILIACWTLTSLGQPAPVHAEENTLTPAELADGWILLFDGETTFGWRPTTEANWQVRDGVISVSEGEAGLLRTTSQFGDFQLKIDFRAPQTTNSGIFLRTSPRPKNVQRDCYELNIATRAVSPFPTGSLVGRAACDRDFDTTTWHTYDVTARGRTFVIKLDGETVLEYEDPQPRGHGYLGLQLNSGKVEFRNIKLKPLEMKPLFNGRDLSGWKEYPGKQSVYSVTPEGHLNVKNGNGQLETEQRFADFVFQYEVFVNGEHLNSGVFFRSIPGDFWIGYEDQIQNGYRDGDRTRPMDCGTGGFYRRQDARRVVSNDFEWFHKTLIVCGNHMSVWVNGYQVSDWSDPRPPHENPRKGRRLEAGTLILQGHDPTTDISFRNLQAGEIAPR
jgi:hypothetical protein